MIGGVPRFGHITDYMRNVLHWHQVQQRIHYRISSIVWHCVLGNAPSYLLELFILTLACSGGLCGACTTTRQKRAFSIVGPSVWNGLPSDLRSLSRDLPSSFYKLLRLSSLAEPGLGVPLSSYLKGALYKLIYR